MSERTAETLVGAVVLAVAAGFVGYAATVTDLGLGTGGGKRLVAEFRSIGGVSTGADVRIAGVKVGSVSDLALDDETYAARMTLTIRRGVAIPEDTSAKITQAGLLGDTFVALDPGASDFMLEDGDRIQFTQDSVNLLDIVSRFIAGSGGTGVGADGGGSE